MCLSKDRQLNQYWKKVALTACFYVRAARMDYHAPSCPCQLSNLLLKKKKMWYLKLQYLIPSVFCLSSEIFTATLTVKILKCTGVIFYIQLFIVHSVIKIPLAVKMQRDLSLVAQANGKYLYRLSYSLRGVTSDVGTLFQRFLTALFKVIQK